jgi:hypothetical protein
MTPTERLAASEREGSFLSHRPGRAIVDQEGRVKRNKTLSSL